MNSCGIEDPDLSSTLFEDKLYNLTITADPAEGGMVYPASQPFEPFEQIEIVAIPRQEWKFTGWSGDFTGSESPSTITMDKDKNIVAHFELRSYPLEIIVIPENTGSVSERIIQPKTTEYPHGTRVELTANPSKGWDFSFWEGDASGENQKVELLINERKIVIANFEKKRYTLLTEIEGSGKIEEKIIQNKSEEYDFETMVQLTAVPDSGWQFEEWFGDLSGDINPQTIVMDTVKAVKAAFIGKRLSVEINSTEGGTGSVQKISRTETTTEFRFGDRIEIKAEPESGWEFTGWSGDLNTNESPYQFTLTKDISLTANFRKQYLPLIIQKQGSGEIFSDRILDDTTYVEYGSDIMLTAKPSPGWRFSNWSGFLESSDPVITVKMTSAVQLNAVFNPELYLLDLTTEPEGIGEIQVQELKLKSDLYPHGSLLRLTPDPANEKWFFKEWKGDLEGNQAPVDIVFNRPFQVTAVFESYCPESATDASGNEYDVIRIGDLCWTASNLRTVRYANGELIPFINDLNDWVAQQQTLQGAMVNNQSREFSEEEFKWYGSFYNVYAALDPRGVCPAGWRVPSISDWKTMFSQLRADDGRPTRTLMKEGTTYWKDDYGTNETGFNAVGNGKHDHEGSKLLREYAWLWSNSKTTFGDDYFGVEIGGAYNDGDHYIFNTMASNSAFVGGAIRCIINVNQQDE